MRTTTAVIVGAGQAGLAMSRCLTERAIDHVLLERGEVANAWRGRRDSLRLLTANWQSRLPGYRYRADDTDGYMTVPEVIDYLCAGDLFPVDIQPAYDGHRDLLTLRRAYARAPTRIAYAVHRDARLSWGGLPPTGPRPQLSPTRCMSSYWSSRREDSGRGYAARDRSFCALGLPADLAWRVPDGAPSSERPGCG